MTAERKAIIRKCILYGLVALFMTHLGEAWRLSAGSESNLRIIEFINCLGPAFGRVLPSLHPFDLFIGACCSAALYLAVRIKVSNAKKYRQGIEYGSARWGTRKDMEPFMDPVFENNIILTETERLTMSSRPKNPACARNKNVLIIGGSGSGKSRFFIKPNLLQCSSKTYPVSFVVTDPKGELVSSCANALAKKNGYQIRIFNSINFKKSQHYNPFVYLHSEKDILKLVTALIANTKGDGKSNDPFWEKAETLLYTALIG